MAYVHPLQRCLCVLLALCFIANGQLRDLNHVLEKQMSIIHQLFGHYEKHAVNIQEELDVMPIAEPSLEPTPAFEVARRPPALNDVTNNLAFNNSLTSRFSQPCSCPAKHISGCCHPKVKPQLEAWLEAPNVPIRLKTAVRQGYYGALDPGEFVAVPLFIIQRLSREAAQYVTTSQLRAVLATFPEEVVGTVNLLRNTRQDYFNLFLTNLRVDLQRGTQPFVNMTKTLQTAIVATAVEHWGVYERWINPQLEQFSFWVAHLPCDAFYRFTEPILVKTVIPAAISNQQHLSECAKSAIYTRMFQAEQLNNIKTWGQENVVSFASLLTGGPPSLLRTFSSSLLQDPVVLNTLTRLPFTRAQVVAILSPLKGYRLSVDTILALAAEHGNGSLLRYMPPAMLSDNVLPNVYMDIRVANVLRKSFCKEDSSRAYRAGYQVYKWYRDGEPLRMWTRHQIQELGCLIRYLTPLDMARLNLLQMAKDIENSYSRNFEGGDYTHIQTKILFHYGRQLLHLGSGSWTSERFAAIPSAIIPGIPIAKIADFPRTELCKPATVEKFLKAADTKLGLSPPQIMALLKRYDEQGEDLRKVTRTTALTRSAGLMHYIPYVKMKDWIVTDFGTEDFKVSAPQARYWLSKLLGPSERICIDNMRAKLTPFFKGLDCWLVRSVELSELTELLQYITERQFCMRPEVARCMKEQLWLYLDSLQDAVTYLNGTTPFPTTPLDQYWPSIAVVVGPHINRQLTGIELRALPQTLCRTVVALAGDATRPREIQREMRPRNKRENFIQAALACLHNTPFADYRMTLSDASILKFLLSELPADVYRTIPDEVVYKSLAFMQGGCLATNQRQALRNKLISTLGSTPNWSYNDVTLLGCILYNLDSFDFDLIRDDVLQDNVQWLGQCFDEKDKEAKEFKRQCMGELGDRESRLMEERIQYINRRLAYLAERNVIMVRSRYHNSFPFHDLGVPSNEDKLASQILIQPENTQSNVDTASVTTIILPENTAWNKSLQSVTHIPPNAIVLNETLMKVYSKVDVFQRDTPMIESENYRLNQGQGVNMTCDWVRAAGSLVLSLPHSTLVHPANMSSSEFIECIPDLAEFNWPEEARNAIWERIKREVGFPSLPELETMRYLLLSLTDQEIERIDFSASLDLVWAFGQLEHWPKSKLHELAQQFKLTVTPIIENLDAVQITALGYILCGFDANEIRKINVTVYVDSSVAIGEITTCRQDVLEALAYLARQPNAYGNVADWTSATLATIGIVAAGLSPAEIRQHLSPASLSGLTCSAVSHFSLDQFEAITAHQLEYFNADTATCVPDRFLSYLSEAQRYAIYEAGSDSVLRLVSKGTTFHCRQLALTTVASLLFTYLRYV